MYYVKRSILDKKTILIYFCQFFIAIFCFFILISKQNIFFSIVALIYFLFVFVSFINLLGKRYWLTINDSNIDLKFGKSKEHYTIVFLYSTKKHNKVKLFASDSNKDIRKLSIIFKNENEKQEFLKICRNVNSIEKKEGKI